MARYHINPTTGNPGLCRARRTCPFGDMDLEHYSSAHQARQAYENSQGPGFTKPVALSAPEDVLVDSGNPEQLTQKLYREYLEIENHPHAQDVANYTITGFKVNDYLRSPRGRSPEDWEKRMVANFDQFFSSLTPKPRHVYRIVDRRAVAQVLEGGGTFTDPGYISTTQSVDSAIWIAKTRAIRRREDPVLLEMVAPRGVSLQRSEHTQVGSIQTFENEVLLERGLTFKVVSVLPRKKLQLGQDRQDMGQQYAQSRGYHNFTGKPIHYPQFTAGTQISLPTVQLEHIPTS